MSVFRAEHRGTGDEVVSTGLGRALDSRAGNSAIDLDRYLQPRGVDRGASALDLRDHLLNEGLAAETGLNRHDENHVELVEDVHERRDVSRGLESKAGARTDAV